MGGGPASRKRLRSGGRPASWPPSKIGKPVTTVWIGQSGCLAARSGEKSARCSKGDWPSTSGLGSFVGGRPISFRKAYHGLAQWRVAHLSDRPNGPQKAGPRKRKRCVISG